MMFLKLFFIQFANKIGMDKSIAYSSGAGLVQGIAGVGMIFFIASFLDGVEQGYYFTFNSILAMQVFFELGLTGIITQYVAHEASHLELVDNKKYNGPSQYLSRLSSLIHFCVKWYSILSVLVLSFLLIVGWLFFSEYGKEHNGVEWRIPWLLICIGTAMKLFQSPLNSIFMGLGMVKEMNKIRFYQQIIIPITIWIGLACGLKLYVTGIGYVISVIIWQIYVYRIGLYRLLANLWRNVIVERVDYIKEIFPYQWRIALSWLSGYFIFQLFNPVLFATEGAVVAGQMGLTIQALNSTMSLSMGWISTKIPVFSKYIALKDYFSLDRLFNKSIKQMGIICFVLLVLFFLVIVLLNVSRFSIGGNVISDRFLPYIPLILLIIPTFLFQFTYAWATYLRCHKKEPFLLLSICEGVTVGLSTIVFGNLYGLLGVTVGYCTLKALIFPWGYYIFKIKKKQWHDSW